jgi:hypothetical protein
MTTTQSTGRLLQKCARRLGRSRPAGWVARRLPRRAWPIIDLTATTLLATAAGLGLWRAWAAAAQLGVPWWVGALAAAFPAGAALRVAQAAPAGFARWWNWRDHALDLAADHAVHRAEQRTARPSGTEVDR